MEANVKFKNDLDNSILNNEFYLVILRKIFELKNSNENSACACLEMREVSV